MQGNLIDEAETESLFHEIRTKFITLYLVGCGEVADPYKSAYMRNLLFCYNLFNDPEYAVDDRLMGYVYHERVASEKTQSL